MKKQWVFAAALMAFSASSMAVDGYKNLKFGMSEADALATKTCNFKKRPSGEKGVDQFVCGNFKVGGKSTNSAVMLFIGGKLIRFGFEQPVDDIEPILQAMRDKYGAAINPPTRSQIEALERVPNDSVDINFDNNTVTLRLITDERLNQSMLVMYSVKDFDQQWNDLKNSQLSSDL
ncbi:hypothetical protein [Serratia fonticola]|uniref:hypothetical protein n=1 Tax=Serratia fonticola TaxID=47917 RepID=UPI00301C769D